MQALLLWLSVIPTLVKTAIEVAHAVESGFASVAEQTGNSAAKTGADKAALVESTLKTVAASADFTAIPVDKLSGVFTSVVSSAVGVFNKLGWFRKS